MLRESKHDLGDPKVLPVRLFVDAIRGLGLSVVTAERLEELRDVEEQISSDVTKVHVDRRRRVRQRVDMIERGVCGDAGGLGDDAGADDAVNGFVCACGTGTAESDDDDGKPHRCRVRLQRGRRVVGAYIHGSHSYFMEEMVWGLRDTLHTVDRHATRLLERS